MVENIKSYIVDASFIISVLFPDELIRPQSQKNLALITGPSCCLFSNHLLSFEVYNTLKSAVLQKRFSKTEINVIRDNFHKLSIFMLDIDLNATLVLAIKHHLSFYDASYLYLSLHHHYPLLTLDQFLAALAK